MITPDHPLLQLLDLIDQVWVEMPPESVKRGAPRWYSEKTMFKVYMVSLLRALWARRSLWRYLSSTPLVALACGLDGIPDRRTLDRRLADIAPQAEVQIQALGSAPSVQVVCSRLLSAPSETPRSREAGSASGAPILAWRLIFPVFPAARWF